MWRKNSKRNYAQLVCVCVRMFSSRVKSLQISQIPMHMCIETIYKALCNLPFYCALSFIGRGLLYHFFCVESEKGGGTYKMAEKGKQIVA